MLAESMRARLKEHEVLLRPAVTEVRNERAQVELSILCDVSRRPTWGPLWARNEAATPHSSNDFVVVNVVPTGIRAEFGGFSGDAVPVTNVMASVCDTLITHPNCVIASDLYMAAPNIACIEGNLLSRFLLGQLHLLPNQVRRLGVLIDRPHNSSYLENSLNAVNAMRAVGGLAIETVHVSEKPLRATTTFTKSGRALGEIDHLEELVSICETMQKTTDAMAITSEIDIPANIRNAYYDSSEQLPNPWGGVEALLTHTVTSFLRTPAAHAPMLTSWENVRVDGKIDPRDAAETISTTYLCSVLKALAAAPIPIAPDAPTYGADRITPSDVSAVVLPAGAMGGIPALAALAQGIPIVAVRENTTLSPVTIHDLLGATALNNAEVYEVDTYLEAVGVLAALKKRISVPSLRRPIQRVQPAVGIG